MHLQSPEGPRRRLKTTMSKTLLSFRELPRGLQSAALLSVCLAAFAAFAAWAEDPPGVELRIENHRFTPAEIVVPAHQPVVIHIKNLDATAEEFDSSALKVEKVIAGHGEGSVHLRPLAPGRYPFKGEYHEATAQGVVVAK